MEIKELSERMDKSFDRLELSIPKTIEAAIRLHSAECQHPKCAVAELKKHTEECPAIALVNFTWKKVAVGVVFLCVAGGGTTKLMELFIKWIEGA